MITSKQRSYLKRLANTIPAIFQIGKEGLSENFILQVEDALEARELIKIHLLNNSGLEIRDVCQELADKVGTDIVQVIGNKFILYKTSKENPKIELPK